MMMRRVNVVKLVVASDYLSAKHKGVQNGTFNTGEDWSEGICIKNRKPAAITWINDLT